MRRRFNVAAGLLLFCSLSTSLSAHDWPGFRGPNTSGVGNANLPVKWTKDNFLWKVKLPGPGAASPIISGNKVFVVCYTGYGTSTSKGAPPGAAGKGISGKGKGAPDSGGDQKNLRRIIMCLDADKGDVLWQQEVEPKLPEQHWGDMVREHGYTSNTPVTDGERVYVFFGKAGVLAYDFTGKKLWHTDVGSDIYLYGSAASLALYKNLVFVNASAESKSFLALDKMTGKVVWQDRSITPTWASPTLVETKDGTQELVLSQPHKIVGYEPETGKQLWHCQGLPVPDMGSSYCTPVAKDGIVYVAGGAGPGSQATALAVRAGGQGDVTKTHVLWRVKAGPTINSPVICGEYLYCIEGIAICLRTDTGKMVYKERLYSTNAVEYPSPVVAGDKIFMVTRFDGLYVLTTGAKFELVAQNAFEGDNSTFNASPAISNGRMYIRSNAYLYCIGKKSTP